MLKRKSCYLYTILLLVFFSVFTYNMANPKKYEVIIRYDHSLSIEELEDKVGEIDHFFSSTNTVVATVTKKEMNTLKQNDLILSVEKNNHYSLSDSYNILPDSDFIIKKSNTTLGLSDPWNLEMINVHEARKEGYTGKGVKVAVIDTGVAQHHALTISGGTSTVRNRSSWIDDHGHGTLVAGIIAGKATSQHSGVAPSVKLYAVKALDHKGEGDDISLLKAIDWSIQNEMDIINLSLGAPQGSIALKEKMDKAYEAGILVVAASGNSGNRSGTGNTVNYPAKYESVIAVGAVNSSMERPSFSSTGTEVEFAAPGKDILSTYLNNEYAVSDGTSFAAPHTTGMLAILMQKYPNMTNKQLRKELRNHVQDLGEPGRDQWFGYGLINYNKTILPFYGSQVTRLNGRTLYHTSALISEQGWNRSDTVILSRGDRFSDALTGVPLAAKYNAPLLLSRSDRLDDYTKAELKRLGAEKVIILGGHLAISPSVEEQIKKLGITNVERLAGANMHVTAELIAKRVAPNGSDKAIIVSDNRFQDALSVASYAGKEGIPILLANTERIPEATKNALADLGVKEVLLIGGELAISSKVEKQFTQQTSRIAGRTMFDTNIQAFNYFRPDTDKVYIATSERFPDGLSGAALAAKQNVGVLLVRDPLRDVTRTNLESYNYREVYVLGGELAINRNIFKQIRSIVE